MDSIRRPGFFFFAIALIVIAGFRPVGLDLDSELFVEHLDDTFNEISLLSKEPTFWLIQQLNLYTFKGYHSSFFLAYALIAITIKFYSISKLSIAPLFSAFAYFSYFYILQDLTQFRSGVAIGLVFWSLLDIVNRNRNAFLAKIIIASLFHYSAALLFFIYALSPTLKKRTLVFYATLPIAGSYFYLSDFFVSLLPSISQLIGGPIAYKTSIYYDLYLSGEMESADPVSIGILFLLSIYYLTLFLVFRRRYCLEGETSQYHAKVIVVSVKMMGFGFLFLFSFYFIEAFSYRLLQYLFFPLVLILPFLVRSLKPRLIGAALITAFLFYSFIKTASATLDFSVLG